MNPRVRTLLYSFALLAAMGSALGQTIDQVPMYGGIDRAADPALRQADATLIEETSKHFGSRVKASQVFVSNGFVYYGKDDLANAMRRFNQAWLLDPTNPEAYWGFAVVLHDRGRHCDAAAQFQKALALGRYVDGMDPDAGRIVALCALSNKNLDDDARAKLFAQSDALYAEAIRKDSNKGYVYGSLATARYWRGQYAESWAAVRQARSFGTTLPEAFLVLLREKMPEPP